MAQSVRPRDPDKQTQPHNHPGVARWTLMSAALRPLLPDHLFHAALSPRAEINSAPRQTRHVGAPLLRDSPAPAGARPNCRPVMLRPVTPASQAFLTQSRRSRVGQLFRKLNRNLL